MFGPKSKYLCCATYFTSNSIADFLLLTITPFYHERGIIIIPYVKTDIVCKLLTCLCNSLLQVSTWVSASITVDRALTIIFPFVFKSQDMIKRSKYIVALIIVMQPITQILPLIYVSGDFVFCRYYDFDGFLRSLDLCLKIAIPYLVILTFNLATTTALCRNRFRQHSVSGNRDHVHVFTKITIMTGVSFVSSFFLELARGIFFIFDHLGGTNCFWISYYFADVLVYLNSCMNPIICLVVCRSMHDDMKSLLMVVIQRVRRICPTRCLHQESETTNTFPMATQFKTWYTWSLTRFA